ncbi:MAG TPA: zf-HC2 domain-containing protein [Gemmatimonadaceae bacterium]|nr:zf-HC2 domain-containing protein [Gemmatimonadaceae bacterium]
MTSPILTCEMFDVLLPDFLEGTLDDATRSAAEMHVERCDRCAALVRDVRHIAYDAGALPDLTPERDLWSGIEARLEPEVVPITSMESQASHTSHGPHAAAHTPHARTHVRRFVPRVTMGWLAAAALLLMAGTAGVTYQVTKHELGTAPQTVALGGERGPGGRTTAGVPGGNSGIRTIAHSPAEATYDREIAELRASVEARRSELDPATVAIIERNLRVIDTAIAQSRAALAADPGSQFLHDQLNFALGQKVALLRRAALLPSHT